MADSINIKTLNLDELAGVVTLYPWYGAARKELCSRMAKMGGNSWGESQFADSAMYIVSREKIAALILGSKKEDCSDKDIEKILKSYIEAKEQEEEKIQAVKRQVHVAGGDFFTQDQYDKVRESKDNIFSKFAVKAKEERSSKEDGDALSEDFFTETLAEIYAEQGYYDQAKKIYSGLLLKFPEKSAYFAALIEKFDKLINNQQTI